MELAKELLILDGCRNQIRREPCAFLCKVDYVNSLRMLSDLLDD